MHLRDQKINTTKSENNGPSEENYLYFSIIDFILVLPSFAFMFICSREGQMSMHQVPLHQNDANVER
jgi:hypothetical protein